MKRVGFLYEKMCDIELIKVAIRKASKGKKQRHNVKAVLADIDKYAGIVKEILETQSFVPSPYYISERYDHRSQKTRKIQRPKFFPDQIIHWVLMLATQDIIMRGMYHWSCGSVPGRGGKHGHKATERWLRSDPRNTKYALQMDIRRFYDTIPHEKLKAAFRRKIKDKKTLWLIDLIIDTTEIGVPIGNYTSQWFANFYLEPLDHFIKEQLGAKYYVRYVDDLIIYGRNKKKLHRLRRQLFSYMKDALGLESKSNWQIYPVAVRGVDFLGYVFFHTHTKMRGRNFLSFTRQCRKVRRKQQRGEPIPYKMASGLLSRKGMLKHCDSKNILNKYYAGIKESKLKEVIRYESYRQLQAESV